MVMGYYFIAKYVIVRRTYFIGNNLMETMSLVLPFEWSQQTLTFQVCSFSQI